MDFLAIRFPNEAPVTYSGTFERLAAGVEPFGFVVTDDLHQHIYQFTIAEKIQQMDDLHFLSTPPVVISRRDYQIEAQALLNGFSILGVQKAVYSRVKALHTPAKSVYDKFLELCRQYPTACCYLVSSQAFGTWIGATPETLLHAENGKLQTMALAGTRSISSSVPWEKKEEEEHQYVIDAIVSALERNQCPAIEVEETSEKIAGPVKHLFTPISAFVGETSVWNLAMDLHPTPAVCGTPRMAALDLIHSREMHQRELYTGIIGWVSDEMTKLFVNLRCAQIQEKATYLYVGGGFTIDSVPDLEWDETEHKAATLQKILE